MPDDLIKDIARALCCHKNNAPDAWEKSNMQEHVMWLNAALAVRDVVQKHIEKKEYLKMIEDERKSAANEIERLWAENKRLSEEIHDWRSCVNIKKTPDGPLFTGGDRSALFQCYRRYILLKDPK